MTTALASRTLRLAACLIVVLGATAALSIAQRLVIPPSMPRQVRATKGEASPLLANGSELAVRVRNHADWLRSGYTVESYLADAVTFEERVVLPIGTPVKLEVVDWLPPGRGRDGELSLGLAEIHLNGRWRPARSELVILRVPHESTAKVPVDLIGDFAIAGEMAGLISCPERHEIEKGASQLADAQDSPRPTLLDRVVFFRLKEAVTKRP